MKLNSLKITNFMGIGEVVINFDNIKGLTLIEGINHDSATAASNGAGKSNIFEAINWIIFGKTKRGLTGDDVINRHCGKDCCGTLYFDDYRIIRSRKDGYFGTGLLFHKKNASGDWDSVSKGTIKDTQELIESVIGMSELTFCKMAHFGQGDIKDFAALSDGELKTVFEQALGLSHISDDADKVKKRRVELESIANNLTQDNERMSVEIVHLGEKIELLERSHLESERRSDLEEDRLKNERNAIVKIILDKEEELAKKKKGIEIVGNALVKSAEAYKIAVTEYSEATKAYEHARDDNTRAMQNARTISAELSKITSNIADAPKKIGEDCPECGRPFTKDDIAGLTEQLCKNAEVKSQERDMAMMVLDGSQQELRESEAERNVKFVEVEKLKGVEAKIAGLNVEKRHLADLERDIEAYRKRLNSNADETLKFNKLKTMSTVNADVEQAAKRKAECEERIVDNNRDFDRVKVEIETVSMLEEILSNSGLKSYIFDNVTPELNKTVAEYLAILNPAIQVDISTMKKLKSGAYKDKFDVCVMIDNGAGDYKGNSGGERQLVNLAISLGFNSLCRSMTSNSVNVLFLDEPFEALDEAASERAVELCNKFSATIDSPCIIAHNNTVKELIATKVTIEKREGKAKLTV